MPEGKRPLGSPTGRSEVYMKMDLRDIEWNDVDWLDVAQDRLEWTDFLTL
jgi:hypothetical protein